MIFSKLHKNNLENKKITIRLEVNTRQRIVYCMQNFNEYYGWNLAGNIHKMYLTYKFHIRVFEVCK